MQALEEDDCCLSTSNELQVVLQPPVNACSDLTDEDSGHEDALKIDNFLGTLRAEAEVAFVQDEDDEDDASSYTTIISTEEKVGLDETRLKTLGI